MNSYVKHAIAVVALITIVVAVDIAFFKDHPWERLAATSASCWSSAPSMSGPCAGCDQRRRLATHCVTS